jgi:membrane protease YdiL (CAAX protease family)
MTSERAPARAPDVVRDATTVVLWGLVFYAGVQLTGAWLVKQKLAADAVQAALAEWGAGRVGIAWSDADAPPPRWQAIAQRAGRGVALGFTAGVIVLTFALLTRATKIAQNSPAVGQLLVGLLTSILAAVRDELLLRGLVLRALRGVALPLVGIGACGVAAAAAAFGAGRTAPAELVIAAVGGVLFASLWQRDRGAWLAVGAHAAWAWTTGSIVRGGLLDVRAVPGVWGGGDAGIEGSLATLVVLVPLAAAAVVWSRRQEASPP